MDLWSGELLVLALEFRVKGGFERDSVPMSICITVRARWPCLTYTLYITSASAAPSRPISALGPRYNTCLRSSRRRNDHKSFRRRRPRTIFSHISYWNGSDYRCLCVELNNPFSPVWLHSLLIGCSENKILVPGPGT